METTTLKLSCLHCSSCAVDIDLNLEEIPGVKSNTSYQKSETTISFDPTKTTLETIKETLLNLGYSTNN